jgi:phosphosulfolactate synthase
MSLLNYHLPHIPERTVKPRQTGLSMVMDKGLSPLEAKNLCEAAAHLVDFVKLGFGTSAITAGLEEKLDIYRKAGISVYVGGTLFEAFIVRGMFKEYVELVKQLKLQTVEVSDGSMKIDHNQKCEYIQRLSQEFQVISEVGSKDASIHLNNKTWIKSMEAELKAGAFKVIAEARESGTVGIFDAQGKAEGDLIDEIVQQVPVESIIWETPLKTQQIWFIKKFGANVNLGNIASNEVIALETLRLGLRGDTFFTFLPAELQHYKL